MTLLYRIYQWIIFVPLLLIYTIITTLTMIIGCTFGDHKFWGYYPGVFWGKFICRTALLKVNVKKVPLDENQSYIFVANHQSAFDIFLIYGYLGYNFKWIIKGSLRKMFLVGPACAKAGHVFVDKSSRKGIVETMKNMKATLKDGVSTVIFPEGHRSEDGKLQEFKKGAFQTALSLKLPIVPLTINGAYKVLPIHSYKMTNHPVFLTFHDPIPTDKLSQDDISELMEKVKSTIASNLEG